MNKKKKNSRVSSFNPPLFFAGRPQPTVAWLRDDTVIGRQLNQSGPLVKAEVALTHLQRSDLHSQLTCQASNNNRTQPLSATVHIDMNCES